MLGFGAPKVPCTSPTTIKSPLRSSAMPRPASLRLPKGRDPGAELAHPGKRTAAVVAGRKNILRPVRLLARHDAERVAGDEGRAAGGVGGDGRGDIKEVLSAAELVCDCLH
ncbi:hypothetical protein [Massilia eurypsychrophila]|uniref:hypothetical protein n=1 Tax=Massilia eurypsychrophila TaxID=1485217 RepID=UPI0010351635|nr:hypothetical protein [Massilia eurypsychrophila]